MLTKYTTTLTNMSTHVELQPKIVTFVVCRCGKRQRTNGLLWLEMVRVRNKLAAPSVSSRHSHPFNLIMSVGKPILFDVRILSCIKYILQACRTCITNRESNRGVVEVPEEHSRCGWLVLILREIGCTLKTRWYLLSKQKTDYSQKSGIAAYIL